MKHKQNSSLIEDKLPQDIMIEQAAIASILIDKETITDIADYLIVEDFYYDVHKSIIKAIINLHDQNQPVDLITVNNKLQGDVFFEKVGGAAYLDKVVNVVPSSASIEYYLKVIREKSELRRLIKVCTDIISDAYKETDDVNTLIDRAETKIFEIAKKRIRTDFIPIKPALANTLDEIEQSHNNKGKLKGIQSKFFDIDKITGGFQPSDLIILAARPSMGKTAFILNLTEHISLNSKAVALFSLEMSKTQLCQRLISSNSGIDSNKLRMGKFDAGDFPKITASVSRLSKTKIFIDDTPSITTLEIKTKARRLMTREKIDLIIVDYIQLIALAERRGENRQNEIAEISRSLKILARELDIPIIALSQLSRQVELRGGDHRPRLSDLRDSGALEQDADLVMFIYRDEYYYPDDDNVKGKAELIIAKQRNGPTGIAKLQFQSNIAQFNNLQQ